MELRQSPPNTSRNSSISEGSSSSAFTKQDITSSSRPTSPTSLNYPGEGLKVLALRSVLPDAKNTSVFDYDDISATKKFL
ncbi:hypothetical protein TrRE_jg7060 [Triparma retinervis]|uniref:Uncharacterized protein n=1 Tax=Triparma retinervis TaxID=2557542 RepID=A0A9W7E313_9STRA|nr:hypothetical protein TrRE_jg7060 [Triparma retinervis]